LRTSYLREKFFISPLCITARVTESLSSSASVGSLKDVTMAVPLFGAQFLTVAAGNARNRCSTTEF
jgi:hypothetical protein